jgi:hypothetical protein
VQLFGIAPEIFKDFDPRESVVVAVALVPQHDGADSTLLRAA